MRTVFTEKNEFGFWVGGFIHEDGTKSFITNAKKEEWQARDIADRVKETCEGKRNKFDAHNDWENKIEYPCDL